MNCDRCGRFAYAADCDPPGTEYPEVWAARCTHHLPGTDSDRARLELPPGKTCVDCANFADGYLYCSLNRMVDAQKNNTRCEWYPSQFTPREAPNENRESFLQDLPCQDVQIPPPVRTLH